MKNTIALVLVVLIAASAQANDLKANLPFSKNDKASIAALIQTRIVAFEEESGSSGNDLEVFTPRCMTNQVKSERGGDAVVTLYSCSTNYSVDRWNGVMHTVFKADGSQLIEIVYESADGNF
ncbi:MAG TPA: hypothetical protein VM432_13460 [Bdellovibrionales bacterium]|nr:hypothetical protein [Bdellovibrionales bacterium]